MLAHWRSGLHLNSGDLSLHMALPQDFHFLCPFAIPVIWSCTWELAVCPPHHPANLQGPLWSTVGPPACLQQPPSEHHWTRAHGPGAWGVRTTALASESLCSLGAAWEEAGGYALPAAELAASDHGTSSGPPPGTYLFPVQQGQGPSRRLGGGEAIGTQVQPQTGRGRDA